jgi:hypothetical protein
MALSIRRLIGAYLDEASGEASFEIMGVDTQLIEAARISRSSTGGASRAVGPSLIETDSDAGAGPPA